MSETNELTKAEADAYEKVRNVNPKPITIAVVGRGGAGKSSTVNSIVGNPVAPVSHTPMEGTLSVREYPGENNGFQFKIFDTPGFGSTRVSTDAILDELAVRVGKDLEILLYVVPLTLTRLDRIDRSAIQLLHQAFSGKLWAQVVVVFTHADVYGERFAERVDVWTKSLREEIKRVAGVAAANNVGFVAISNGKLTNPDGKEWMGELFTTVAERIGSPLAYIASQFRRMHGKRTGATSGGTNEGSYSGTSTSAAPPINLDEDQRQRVFRRVMVTTAVSGLFLAGGAVISAPVALACGAVGLVLGWLIGDSV